jgi:hypothetical protein
MSKSVRLLNATSTGEIPTFEAPEVDQARLDELPAALRGCFYQTVTKLSTKAFCEHLAWARAHGLGVMPTVDLIDRIEANEIAVAAGEYRALCGTDYPHVAAGVSIQRYGDIGPSKHPPRNYGKPVIRPPGAKQRRR